MGAVKKFSQEINLRLAALSNAAEKWQDACDVTAQREMERFYQKVETIVRAENLVMQHEFNYHDLKVKAMEKEIALGVSAAKADEEKRLVKHETDQKMALDEIKKDQIKAAAEDEKERLKAATEQQKEFDAVAKQKAKDEAE